MSQPPEDLPGAVSSLDWLWRYGVGLLSGALGAALALWRGGATIGALRAELKAALAEIDALKLWRETITRDHAALQTAIGSKPDRSEVRDWFESLRRDIRALGRASEKD